MKEDAVSSAVKSERKDIYFEHYVMKNHFQEKIMVENAIQSNGFSWKRKKKHSKLSDIKILVCRKQWI